MLCEHCGTDTPHPAIACQSCRTPFPALSASNTDSETLTYGTGAETGTPSARPRKGTGPLELGAPFGTRYRILRELGAGGMGVVYQAWDAELGVAVALKVVRPEVSNDPEISEEVTRRFKRELLLARQVTHKNVVRIHDLGEIDGIKYITMPYIEGRDLAGVMRERGPLPAPEALRIGRQIAAGLLAAHDAGVVHRDLKPENIMIDTDGQALIMDFGISRSVTTGGATVTVAGAVMGTLEYMAPEQATGVVVDHRADQYALGLILHDMLAGRRRVATGSNALSEMMGRMQQQPPALRTIAAEIPEALERIVTKCLQPKPEDRYDTTRALADALNALDPDGHSPRRPLSRDYQWKIATATMLVLILIGAGTAVWFARHAAGTSAPAVARDPVSVLIADFGNQTQDQVFEGALEQSLAIALEGSPFITVYSQKNARAIAARLAPGRGNRITTEVGQLIARSEGIKVLVDGAIAKQGAGYRIELRAIDSLTGKPIAQVTRNISDKAQVLPTVSDMATSVREGLGESQSEMTKVAAAETVSASSLEAMSAYARGQELNYAGRQLEALKAFQEAVRLDPGLARAYAGMGVIYGALKQDAKVEESYKNALKHIDRMSDREKYRTLGGYYLLVTHNYEKAIENYENLVRLYPADDTGHANLAYAYLNVRNMPKAMAEGRKAIEIYPNNTLQRTNYAMYSMYAGDFSTAIAESKKVLEANPTFEYAMLTVANSQRAAGDLDGARQTWDRLAAVGPLGASMASLGRADLAMSLGRHREAVRLLADGIKIDEAAANAGEAAAKYVALAEAQQALGTRADAVRSARKAASLRVHESVVFPAAIILADSGNAADIAFAAELAVKLENRLQNQTTSYARLIAGYASFRQKRLGQALDAFRDAQKLHDSWFAHLMLGRAYLEANRFAEAVAEFEECLKRKGEATDVFFENISTSRYLPPVYYWLGLAQEGLGAAPAAKASYEQFVKLLAQSDPADPLAADASARLKKF